MTDWRRGDIALCVSDRQWMNIMGEPLPSAPRRGRFYTVAVVMNLPHYGGVYLHFGEWPSKAWDDRAFVKVTPPRELIEEERKAGVSA